MKQWCILLLLVASPCFLLAQQLPVALTPDGTTVRVDIGGKFFCNFIYPDTLEKPVLYPIFSPEGHRLTRGYPTGADERTDHPHHVGLWFNYENVNGLDFWNNSSAISSGKKAHYGWIRKVQVTDTEGRDSQGHLSYLANWEQQDEKVLLVEATTFTFSGDKNTRFIDRVTTLTAQEDTVHFSDAKDGLLGLRVVKELELPDTTRTFTDIHGNVTTVAASDHSATGDYLTSAGKTGNDAWGTRGNWCMLYGTVNNEKVAITIIDHPKNPGYPTYWHARNYGLFAANPLGQQVFSKGATTLNYKLAPGASVTFRYRIVISSGAPPSRNILDQQATQFSSIKIQD